MGSTRYASYPAGDCWPSVGGLLAVNAIGTQLRDLIKLRADPMVVDGMYMDTIIYCGKPGGEEPVGK